MVDRDRAAVYAAEEQWSALLDRGGRVQFFGSDLYVEQQRRFADLASVQRYVDAVLALSPYAAVPAVHVRKRKGGTRAHYGDGVIAIPIQERWSGREAVVLHEIAHHVNNATEPAHGPTFRSTMVELARHAHSPEAALLLTVAYREAGLT